MNQHILDWIFLLMLHLYHQYGGLIWIDPWDHALCIQVLDFCVCR